MNGSQKATLQRVIKNDCEIRTRYMTQEEGEEPQYCILGGMAVEAAVKLPGKSNNSNFIGYTGTKLFANKIAAFFGLNLAQLQQLQRANDGEAIRKARQEAVHTVLETFEVNDDLSKTVRTDD